MTLSVLKAFGIDILCTDDGYKIKGNQKYTAKDFVVEGDWSNGAFWLVLGALNDGITVQGLDKNSLQGDKAVFELLKQFGANCEQTDAAFTVSPAPLHGIEIDAAAIPDLVPILSVVAAKAEGTTRIYHAERLRLKESDRIETVCRLLRELGGVVEETPDGLLIHGGTPLQGGTADSCNDHRIAMAAAIASSICQGPVTILGAEAVNKSYPHFWDDHAQLCK